MGEVIGCSRQVFSFWKNTTGHGTAEAKLLPLRHLRPASTGVSGTHYLLPIQLRLVGFLVNLHGGGR